MKFELDQYDIKMIHTAICYFDMHEGGEYDEWFGDDVDDLNDAFHYLFNMTTDYLNSTTSETPLQSPVTPIKL